MCHQVIQHNKYFFKQILVIRKPGARKRDYVKILETYIVL